MEIKTWEYVGHLDIGPMRVAWEKRPSWWCQFWMKTLLGWTWTDYAKKRNSIMGHQECDPKAPYSNLFTG